jgi:hypothetical protein
MTLSYIPSDTNDEGILKATASGVLPNGKPVIVNSDGTVSVVDETAISQALGSPSVYASSSTIYGYSAFDSTNNKVVIAYRDVGNTNKGTAVVGTVSGTSISFGTPVVFESAEQYDVLPVVFDSNANKIVIFFTNSSFYGTAIVGTVSGTSISFGTPVVFDSSIFISENASAAFDSSSNKVVVAYKRGTQSHSRVGTVSGTSISFGTNVQFESGTAEDSAMVFDSNAGKIVIVYSDVNNSRYGTAVVGTVSGTSISFGSSVVFESADTREPHVAFDSTSNQIIITYRDTGNSSYGTAVVGSVSGTSINFGSPVVFESALTSLPCVAFDPTANKVVIAYADGGNSYYGTVITGTITGTSLSFDSPSVFESANASPYSATYDSNSSKVVVNYVDSGNSGYGTSVVFQAGYTSTTLTASNYIGISTGGTYADGSNATVKIIGNTSDEQSGLTAGQAYYVQTDGTIGTTPADPSVFAGTAISATKMLVKT